MRKSRIKIVAAVSALLVGVLAAWLWLSSFPPAIALPNPNGFDVLMEASQSVQQSILTKDDTKLKEFLALNRGPMELVDQAAGMECVVPIDFSAGMANLPMVSRDAFRLWDARARVLQQDGASHAAAIEWAKMFAYSKKTANGGVLVHMLTAVAFESMALNGLETVMDDLSSAEKHEVLAVIEAANRQPHDFASLQEREYSLVRGEYGPVVGAYLVIASGSNSKPAMEAAQTADERVLTQLNRVVAMLKQ